MIYVHLPDLNLIYLLDVYSKDESDDISSESKQLLKKLVLALENELRAKPLREDNDKGDKTGRPRR